MSEPDPSARSAEPEESGERREPAGGGDSILRPLLTDPSLRGLLVAGGGILVTFGAWMIAMAVGSRSLPAIGALGLVAVLSAEGVRADVRRARRPGAATWLVLAFWLLSGGIAWAGIRFGLL